MAKGARIGPETTRVINLTSAPGVRGGPEGTFFKIQKVYWSPDLWLTGCARIIFPRVSVLVVMYNNMRTEKNVNEYNLILRLPDLSLVLE